MLQPQPASGVLGFLARLGRRVKDVVADPIEAVSRNVVVEAKAFGWSALGVTTFVIVGIVGYVFAMLGLAWIVARHIGMAETLLLIGGAHLVVGVVGTAAYVRSTKKLDPIGGADAVLVPPPVEVAEVEELEELEEENTSPSFMA